MAVLLGEDNIFVPSPLDSARAMNRSHNMNNAATADGGYI